MTDSQETSIPRSSTTVLCNNGENFEKTKGRKKANQSSSTLTIIPIAMSARTLFRAVPILRTSTFSISKRSILLAAASPRGISSFRFQVSAPAKSIVLTTPLSGGTLDMRNRSPSRRWRSAVIELLSDFEKVDVAKLTLDSHFINDLGLDSLDQVEITMALEDEFNIEIPDRDADEIFTPRQAIEKIFANKSAM
ncbi:acyl carrier protein-like protein [Chytridium lagenaria]|nr:acyl carrier protein-like protein [Chytridium lagenaria]